MVQNHNGIRDQHVTHVDKRMFNAMYISYQAGLSDSNSGQRNRKGSQAPTTLVGDVVDFVDTVFSPPRGISIVRMTPQDQPGTDLDQRVTDLDRQTPRKASLRSTMWPVDEKSPKRGELKRWRRGVSLWKT